MAKLVRVPWGASKPLPIQLWVPITTQTSAYSCGAASLLSVLRYWKGTRTPKEEAALREALDTDPETGTEPDDIARVARSNGLKASYEQLTPEELEFQIDHGHTIILAFQAWKTNNKPYAQTWEEGHYAVLVGFDDENYYFMDPNVADAYAFMPKRELAERWQFDYRGKRVNRTGIVVWGTGNSVIQAMKVPRSFVRLA